MVNPPTKYPEPSTEMAVKYGVDNTGLIAGMGRSGYSPLTPEPHKKDSWREDEAWKYWEVRMGRERAQIARLMSWTSGELEASRAFGPSWDFQSASLNNPIHPVFDLERWERISDQYLHLAVVPIGSGISGYWEAHNPVVWNVMQTSLRLASLCLANAHIWPWWDALLNGELHKIHETNADGKQVHRMCDGAGLYKLKTRDRDLVAQDKDKTRDLLLESVGNIVFSFGDGVTNPRSDLPFPNPRVAGGVTFEDIWTHRVFIRCDYHQLAPLLFKKLTKGEELIIQWQFGIMLVHELTHALWILRLQRDESCREVHDEPYFEDEPVAELGNSLTGSLMNGIFFLLNASRDNRGEKPTLGIVRVPWPSMFISGNNPVLYEVGDGMNQEFMYAIPIDYFYLTLQDEFWEAHVPAFGVQSLYFEPLYIGKGMAEDGTAVSTQAKVNPMPSTSMISKYPFVWRENRNLDRKIKESVATMIARSEELETVIDKALENVDQKPLDPIPLVVRDIFEPPARHEIITWLVIKYRFTLAIETQDFALPELTLLTHVNRLDAIQPDIERGEWRQYLQYMTYNKKELFIFTPYPGGGTVSINFDAGWPTLLAPRANSPISRPPSMHIAAMRNYMAEYGDDNHYGDSFPDVDQDAFLAIFEAASNINFTPEELDTLVRWFIAQNELWKNAPPMIMRVREKFDFANENRKLQEEQAKERLQAKKKEFERKRTVHAKKREAMKKTVAQAKRVAMKIDQGYDSQRYRRRFLHRNISSRRRKLRLRSLNRSRMDIYDMINTFGASKYVTTGADEENANTGHSSGNFDNAVDAPENIYTTRVNGNVTALEAGTGGRGLRFRARGKPTRVTRQRKRGHMSYSTKFMFELEVEVEEKLETEVEEELEEGSMENVDGEKEREEGEKGGDEEDERDEDERDEDERGEDEDEDKNVAEDEEKGEGYEEEDEEDESENEDENVTEEEEKEDEYGEEYEEEEKEDEYGEEYEEEEEKQQNNQNGICQRLWQFICPW